MTIGQRNLQLQLGALAYLVSVVSAFTPTQQIGFRSSVLNANVATSFILQEFEKEQQHALGGANKNSDATDAAAAATSSLSASTEQSENNNNNNGKSSQKKLSRPERKALERAKKKSNRKNNGQKQQQQQPSSSSKYQLHSQAVSSLTSESTAEQVLRAIKRAQNLHDAEDLKTIEKFLLEEVDEDFAYGYRGSLLSRLAVAALHMNNHELARKAMDVRRVEYRPSMLPLESAAIIRGLLRVHNVSDALEVLDDELSLPLQVRLLERSSLH